MVGYKKQCNVESHYKWENLPNGSTSKYIESMIALYGSIYNNSREYVNDPFHDNVAAIIKSAIRNYNKY